VSGTPPSPPSDDEVERRLAALKAGADPGSFGAPDEPRTAQPQPAEPPAAGPARPTDDEGPADPDGNDPGPALTGEVIEDGGTWTPRRGAEPGAPPGGSPGQPPAGPGVRAVSWGISQAEAGRLGLWIGIGLVAFGGYLVLAQLVPGIALAGSAVLAAAGVALVAWHLAGRAGSWAVHTGAILAGFGIARVVADVANLPSAGWGTLGAGLGLLAIAGVRIARGEGVHWQAWVGGALTVFGGWGALGAVIPGFPTLGDLIVPVVLVLVGVVVVRRGVRT
jgi:hypothetical protein